MTTIRHDAAHIAVMENTVTTESDPTKPASVTPGAQPKPPMPKEIGGPKGPEPTRYGDWEQKGRCTDF